MNQEITFVTGNAKKLAEREQILGCKLRSQNIDLPEYQGKSEYVSYEKCKLAANIVKGPVLIEDTSLCFNALNSLPGPFIKWFYDEIGNENIFKLLTAFPDHTGYALCIFCLFSRA